MNLPPWRAVCNHIPRDVTSPRETYLKVSLIRTTTCATREKKVNTRCLNDLCIDAANMILKTSVYVSTRQLARGDLILPMNQLISNRLARCKTFFLFGWITSPAALRFWIFKKKKKTMWKPKLA